MLKPVVTMANNERARIPVVFDMETRDPDDVLTLCILTTHPAIDLVAVTVTPGTRAQVGVIRTVLDRLGRRLPVGARDPSSSAAAVTQFHFDWLGQAREIDPDGVAHEVLASQFTANDETVLLTGAPLQNVRMLLLQHPNVRIKRWVAQGGFAGETLVAPANRLPKFKGRTACESFNFGHDKKGTLAALSSPQIQRRELVSKNVTHGIAWDAVLQCRLSCSQGLTAGAGLAREGMAIYLQQYPEGKLLHDPMAAAALIDRGAFTWEEVSVQYAAGQWSALSAAATNTFITVAADRERAFNALFAPVSLPKCRETR
jgi:inosine-uridine nucleoside N-ribohydrolase